MVPHVLVVIVMLNMTACMLIGTQHVNIGVKYWSSGHADLQDASKTNHVN